MSENSYKNLRNQLRGSDILTSTNDPFYPYTIMSALENTDLEIPINAFNGLIPNTLWDPAKNCLKQRLLSQLSIREIMPKILVSLSPMTEIVEISLPKPWLVGVEKFGIKINKRRSMRLWRQQLLKRFVVEVLKAFRILLRSIFRLSLKAENTSYVVLNDLQEQNFCSVAQSKEKYYDFMSWFKRFNRQDKKIWCQGDTLKKNICDQEISTTRFALPRLKNTFSHFCFFMDLIRLCTCSLKSLVFGDWWVVLMTEELALINYLKYLDNKQLADHYVFHSGRAVIRPLWTYETENRGADVSLAFYSANCQLYGTSKDLNRPIAFGYKGLTWTKIFVWNSFQKEWLQSSGVKTPYIEVVGPIGFVDTTKSMPSSPKPKIAVFDVTPYRSVKLAQLGLVFPTNTGEIVVDFLETIFSVLSQAGFDMVLKVKRNSNKDTDRHYIKTLNKLKLEANFINIDPEISPQRVLEKCTGCISFPFTSTAIIADEMGIPSVYFDAIGEFSNEKKLSNGLKVLTKKTHLKEWVNDIKANLNTEIKC